MIIEQRLNAPIFKFLRIILHGGVVACALMGIQSQGVELPQVLTVVADKAYVLAGLVAMLIAEFTVDRSASAVDAIKKQNTLWKANYQTRRGKLLAAAVGATKYLPERAEASQPQVLRPKSGT